jgi:hypothetical protein
MLKLFILIICPQKKKSFASKFSRFCAKHIPTWLFDKIQAKAFAYRPQAAFLPLVKDTGRVKTAPQPSLYIKAPVESDGPVKAQAL